MTAVPDNDRIGVVVIGRNEGERLRACLASLARSGARVVYADSGSTDGSPGLARSLGVEAVLLDASAPFTAARGRNAGLARLLEIAPGVEFVQFIDGDCEMNARWLEAGVRAIESDARVAVVCGRLREKNIEGSVYNRLCDMEWDRAPGVVDACGGISLMRASALRETGGFNATLAVGEEPELCLRLRRREWTILRLPDEMATHDAAMTRFGQWWKRAVRTGQAAAETGWLHRREEGLSFVRRLASPLFWGAALPVGAVALAWPTHGLSLLALIAYPIQWARIRRTPIARGRSAREASIYATFTLVGKVAEVFGVIRAARAIAMGRTASLIEYKSPSPVCNPPASPELSEAAR